jgi:long-subunit fatty acid transport protein
MKISLLKSFYKTSFIICLFLISNSFLAQTTTPKPASEFWKKVQFGGGLGLGFGSDFTNISIAPNAIYKVNEYVGVGLGLQYSYLKQKNFYSSNMYGASLITLINPIEQIQLSVELEQLRVNVAYQNPDFSDDFWNTGLFLGAGYRTGNVTIGARYNVLFDKDKGVYGDAFMPFVRVLF